MTPNQIYAGTQQQQNYAQGQSDQYQGQVNQDIGQTNNALQNLTSYQTSLQDPSNQLGNIYSQGLTNYNNLYGVNPQAIQQANQVLAQTQDTLAALPQAVQQGANGRMLTGAQEATRYAQTAAPVQQQLTNQSNALQALQANAGLAQTAAGQYMAGQGQSQQMQLGALQNEYQDSLQRQQQAQAQVQYFQTLKQQGFSVDTQLYAAQAQMAQANAMAAQAAAAMVAAQAQMGQLTLAQNAATAAQNGPRATPNTSGGFNYFNGQQPITIQQYGQLTGQNPSLQDILMGQNQNPTNANLMGPPLAPGSPGLSFVNGSPGFGLLSGIR